MANCPDMFRSDLINIFSEQESQRIAVTGIKIQCVDPAIRIAIYYQLIIHDAVHVADGVFFAAAAGCELHLKSTLDGIHFYIILPGQVDFFTAVPETNEFQPAFHFSTGLNIRFDSNLLNESPKSSMARAWSLLRKASPCRPPSIPNSTWPPALRAYVPNVLSLST